MFRTACLIGASLATLSVAAAEDGWTFDISGFLDAAAFDLDQDMSGFAGRDPNGIDALVNGKVIGQARYLTEGGWELGARGELRLQSGRRSNSTSGAADALVMEKLYLSAESGLGRVEIGAQDGAADLLHAAAPSITKSMRIDDPLMVPVVDSSGGAYRPGGLMLRTDPYASDQSAKIVYRSPRLFGLQIGVSYTPEYSANLERFVKGAGDDPDQQSNIWEAGINYDSTLDQVRLKASLVYLTGENERASDVTVTPDSPWRSGDLSEWAGALNVTYKGLSLGGAYRHSNARGGFVDHAPVVLTGGASDTQIWSVGALYRVEDWSFGMNYVRGETKLALADPLGGRLETQDGEAWQIAGAYQIEEKIQIAAGFQRYDFSASAGANPFGLAEAPLIGSPRAGYAGDMGANILFTELSFGF